MEKKNPAPGATGDGATFGMRVSAECGPNSAHVQEPKLRLRLIEWRSLQKNTLCGFATVELPSGLTITDVSVHLSHGKAWASLPARPQMDRDGTPRRGDDGKVLYNPILKWRNRDLADRFSFAVVNLVRAQHPDDLRGVRP